MQFIEKINLSKTFCLKAKILKKNCPVCFRDFLLLENNISKLKNSKGSIEKVNLIEMQKNRSGLSSTNSKQELISEMNLVEIM